MPKPRHVHETYIRTTPDRLWAALTEPGEVRSYYYGCDYDGPLVPGQPYKMSGEYGPAIDGTVVAVDPPHRLAVTFHVLFDPEAATEEPTNVTWEITPVSDQVCRLTLVHEDFGGLSKTWAITLTGWKVVLDGLKTWVETGTAIGEITDDRSGAVVAVDLTAEEHRERGIEIYNDTWRYIGIEERTAEQDEEMIRSAYASAYHWSHAARRTAANDARGEWPLSRVHVLAERPDTALHHARRCATACRVGRSGRLRSRLRPRGARPLARRARTAGRGTGRTGRCASRSDRRSGGPQDLRRRSRDRPLVRAAQRRLTAHGVWHTLTAGIGPGEESARATSIWRLPCN